MQLLHSKIVLIGILTALFKGFSVLYFLFLPILFNEGIISAAQVGYIGSLLIVGILTSAFLLSHTSGKISKSILFSISLLSLFLTTILLFIFHDPILLGGIYLVIGLATGVGLTIVNELAAQVTDRGKRFGAFANIAMLMDVVRISYPVIVAGIYIYLGMNGLVFFALTTIFATALLIRLIKGHTILGDLQLTGTKTHLPLHLLKTNKRFSFTLFIEFLDSFSSSQLFVFLPTLLIFRGFPIESALGLQSVVFAGYLSGRWFVSLLANKLNGYIAVALAEIGMIGAITLLLILSSSIILYGVCFLLGVFTRGTSPVIKALVFDQLDPEHNRQGSALHIFFGDAGSAAGQLTFGLSLAWIGVSAPFIGAAIGAGIVAASCLLFSRKYKLSLSH